jgi:hypothetical protein
MDEHVDALIKQLLTRVASGSLTAEQLALEKEKLAVLQQAKQA